MNQILTDKEMRDLEKLFHAERVRTSDEEYLIIYPGEYGDWQRAIEAAILSKLNSAEPVAFCDPNTGALYYATHTTFDVPKSVKAPHFPLFIHPPAPSAEEGFTLVPNDILDAFPEINPSNYDHDDVCHLNAWAVELVLAAARSEK